MGYETEYVVRKDQSREDEQKRQTKRQERIGRDGRGEAGESFHSWLSIVLRQSPAAILA